MPTNSSLPDSGVNVNENGIFPAPAAEKNENERGGEEEPQLNHITAGGSPTLQLFAMLEKIEQTSVPPDGEVGTESALVESATTNAPE